MIAEGIESEEQRDSLVTLHCGLGQGFNFFHPLDRDATARLICRQSPAAG